jgi:phage gp36-like protein
VTYATQADLVDRFGEQELVELADRDGDGAIDTAVVAAALADADTTIDAYVGKRYGLPLAATPALLRRLAGDLARHFLYKDDPTEAVQAARDAAIRMLRDIASGSAVLDVAGAEPARDGQAVLTDGPARTFSRTALEGF